MILPIRHIGRREQAPIVHVKILGAILIMSSEKVHAAIVQNGRWVGRIDSLNDWIVGSGDLDIAKKRAKE